MYKFCKQGLLLQNFKEMKKRWWEECTKKFIKAKSNVFNKRDN